MKNFRWILFSIFLILYVAGVFTGSTRQVALDNQGDMYEYLEGAVSGYDIPVSESIKSVLNDNMKLFICLALGGFFILGPVLLGTVMLVKGYSAGFAITAVLRLFGIRGLTFCVANLVSSAIIVPILCWYSYKTIANIQENRYERKEFLKRFFVLLSVVLIMLLIDGIVRGFLSAILMKFAHIG